MQKLKALNSRELKEFYKVLEEQFGHKGKFKDFVLESSKEKLYLLSRDYEKLEVTNLRVNNKAMYFGKKEKDGLRLSIEGAQLVKATKNVVELDKKGVERWVSGEDVNVKHETDYVIVKFKDDALGCGRVVNNVLRNMVPKERRLKELSS
jgi:NOL1/NOP2/fmu family ribosome biogenesis protein